MPEQLPLDTLSELARERAEEATRRLGVLNTALLNARQQLDMLAEYRHDYLARLQQAMCSGMSASDCQNYQRFIGTLDDAMAQQRHVVAQSEAELEAGRIDWQQAKRKQNSFEALTARAQRARDAVEQRREQRGNDEFAARMLTRSPVFG